MGDQEGVGIYDDPINLSYVGFYKIMSIDAAFTTKFRINHNWLNYFDFLNFNTPIIISPLG